MNKSLTVISNPSPFIESDFDYLIYVEQNKDYSYLLCTILYSVHKTNQIAVPRSMFYNFFLTISQLYNIFETGKELR